MPVDRVSGLISPAPAPVSTPISAEDDVGSAIGYDVIGPVIHRWLIGLDQYISYLDRGETRFLLCARAGVRIARLYALCRAARGLAPRDGLTLFWASRLSVCKGVYARAPKAALKVIEQELGGLTLAEAVHCLLRNQPELARRLDLGSAAKARAGNLGEWLEGGSAAARDVGAYLARCGEDLDAYRHQLCGDAARVVLIDSGWKGTMQMLLMRAYREQEWWGLYVGRMRGAGYHPAMNERAIGILFERDHHDPSVPASALCECRHLIETILEPNGESVAEIPDGHLASIAERQIRSNLPDVADAVLDKLFLAVERYIGDHAAIPISEAFGRYEAAVTRLERIILAPTPQEAHGLLCKDRCADFGRTTVVPVLAPTSQGTRADRMRGTLWRQGQAAIEIERDGTDRPTAAGGEASSAATDARIAVEAMVDGARAPSVAIITRTRDRPILLERAAASVGAQHHRNYQWIVVNDGGNGHAVRDVLDRSCVPPGQVTLISNAVSGGMEAASNLGIAHADAEFIVIHDDDDSWDPRFLTATLGFLTSPEGAAYGGVITKTIYVSEQMLDSAVIERDRYPFKDWVDTVHIADMACENLFPPIAFVYRRECWERIGGYDERLPVLGDWAFNLEFLLTDDIGVLLEPLAFYHHRDEPGRDDGHYSNSVVAAAIKHRQFAAVVRNRFVRKHPHSPIAHGIVAGHIVERKVRGRETVAGGGGGFIDAADKRWVVCAINAEAARRLAAGHEARVLPADAGWDMVCATLGELGIAPPVPPDFGDRAYLALYPDVEDAIATQGFGSGYHHYILHGREEGRGRPLALQTPASREGSD